MAARETNTINDGATKARRAHLATSDEDPGDQFDLIHGCQIKPFQYEDSPVHVITNHGELWFLAHDVLGILRVSLEDAREIVSESEFNNGLNVDRIEPLPRKLLLLSEFGLHRLVAADGKKRSLRFIKWVTKRMTPDCRMAGIEEFASLGLTSYARMVLDIKNGKVVGSHIIGRYDCIFDPLDEDSVTKIMNSLPTKMHSVALKALTEKVQNLAHQNWVNAQSKTATTA